MDRLETWRPVVGYEGLFEVSDLGNVRSLDRLLSDGRLWRARSVNAKTSSSGHVSVRLCANGQHKWRGVHCLVLESFVGPCPPRMEGCHNDGKPANNWLSNLRWDTRSGNHADKIIHGTSLLGARNHLAKLTASEVQEIRKRSDAGETGRALAHAYGVTAANISSIINQKTWGHLWKS